MTKPRLDALAMVTLVVLCASWGLQQVAIKVVMDSVSPIMQASIRSAGAMVLVWVWMTMRGIPVLDRDGTLYWGLAAGILFAAEFLLIYQGLGYTNASRAVIFLYIAPFVVAIGAQLFIPGEHLRPIQVIGLVAAFMGIIVAFGESLGLPSTRMLKGDAMIALAAVLWGATTVLIKASPLAGIAPSKTLLYQLAVSALLLPLGLPMLGASIEIAVSPLVIASLLFQTVWVAGVTYLIWFWLIRHYPASRVSAFTFLTPLFGVLAGGLLLDEPLTGTLLVALLLVGSGIYLVNRSGSKVASKTLETNEKSA